MMTSPPLKLFLLSCLAYTTVTNGQNISDDLEGKIKARLADGAKKSWELGTRAQTLLELDAPEYSVFTPVQQPPPQTIPSNTTSGLSPVFSIAENVVKALNIKNTSSTPEALMEDGAAGDPPSIGVAVLLANWTHQSGASYATAARNQINYLYTSVPKTDDGAISHRVSQAQLWSDNVYMVPPFLAFYGLTTQNSTWLGEAYNQIKLYRNNLRDTSQGNLWKHVVFGSGTDEGHWTTGNGWAAMGMLRVYATIKNSQYADDYQNEQKDLIDWTKEVLGAVYNHLDKTNIFANYPEKKIESGNFYDAAGTALIAASTYRLALLAEEYHNLPAAENIRKTISTQNSDGSWKHFDNSGWLTPVVNPHSYGSEGSESAEGQAFVLMMQQAWREWVQDGSQGANAAVSSAKVSSGLLLAVLVGMGMTLL